MKKASVNFSLTAATFFLMLHFSNCWGLAETSHAPVKVAEILTPKSFRTLQGDVVRLACLQAPNIQKDRGKMRSGQPMGEAAMTRLEELVGGQEVTLTSEPPLLDRHGRRVAFVQLANGSSVQEAMLTSGMALVYPFADCRERLPGLLAAEARAREKGVGIWGKDYWRPVDAEKVSLKESEERYQLVTGVVKAVARAGKGDWYLNFGEDYKTDFTAFIRAEDYRKEFKKMDLKALVGKKLLLRGWVYERDGVMMETVLPEQIEALP